MIVILMSNVLSYRRLGVQDEMEDYQIAISSLMTLLILNSAVSHTGVVIVLWFSASTVSINIA